MKEANISLVVRNYLICTEFVVWGDQSRNAVEILFWNQKHARNRDALQLQQTTSW